MNETNAITASGSDFTLVSVGMVLRMPLEVIPDLKDALSRLPTTKVIYQKTTAGFLRIIEEGRP